MLNPTFFFVAPGKSPREFRKVEAEYVSIILSWKSIDEAFTHDPIVKYRIRYGRTGDSNVYKYVETENTRINITGLIHDTRYHFAVAGVTENATGVYTEPLKVKTLKSK